MHPVRTQWFGNVQLKCSLSSAKEKLSLLQTLLGPRFLKANLSSKDQGKESIEYLQLFHIFCHKVLASSPQGHIPWDSSKQDRVCSPEVQGCDLAFHPPPSPQDPELHNLTDTTAKADFDLHILNKPPCIVVLGVLGPAEHLSSLASLSLMSQVITDALREPPGLLMSYCVVFPKDIGVLEVPHEDQGLQR